jgi:PAS domain S-box-containing protein
MDMRTLIGPADRPDSLAMQMARHLLEMTDEAVSLTDRRGLFCDVNAAFERLTGYDRLEVIGRSSNLMASGRHDREFYRSMWRSLQERGRWEGTICDLCRDGTHKWFRLRIAALHDGDGNTTHFLGVLRLCMEQSLPAASACRPVLKGVGLDCSRAYARGEDTHGVGTCATSRTA